MARRYRRGTEVTALIGRRGFIAGLACLVAAPAIVRAGSLMPVRAMLIEPYGIGSATQMIAQPLPPEWMNMREVTEKYARDEIIKIIGLPSIYMVCK
jgi:hypothetical protein